MKKTYRRLPWFYILFTLYPLLFLWAVNISQIDPIVVIRPFLFTLFGSAILYGILYLVFRDVVRAGLVGTLFLVAFFTYGRVYYGARAIPALNIFAHHTVLIPIYIILLGMGIWGIFQTKKHDVLVLYLNAASMVLVVLQVVELSYAYIWTSYETSHSIKVQSNLTLKTDLKDMPDIYVIILDTYMRSDALKQDLGYDNSAFIDQLTQMGFYVAKCGHPNYTFTFASISALLNMSYVPQAYTNDVWSEFSNNGFWSNLIKNDQVRQLLKSVGYKLVGFEEDNPMVEFDDSDVLIGSKHSIINPSYLYPFEAMYKQSTAAIILNALDPKGKIAQIFQRYTTNLKTNSVGLSGLTGENKDFVAARIISTRFILDHIANVPAIAGPKFTYIHIFVPHRPYVWDPNGEIVTDPGFYSGQQGDAVNSDYEARGYVNQVQYIDKRMIPILQTVINKSKNPPIIILMGDHGLNDTNRRTDLLAYYFPGIGSSKLYPTISPVNSFRLIFDEYFGANYPLLPDETYISDTATAPDAYPVCAP
jgi:hypothetical protein